MRTRVDEQDVINVHLGERALITGEDFPGHVLSGHVVEVSPIVQRSGDAASASHTVATTIAVDRPPSYLRDGVSVNVNILTTDLPRAIVVPSERSGTTARRPTFTSSADNAAYRRPVRAGPSNDKGTAILSGLEQRRRGRRGRQRASGRRRGLGRTGFTGNGKHERRAE